MDLQAHLKRQIAFSRATFGPGKRVEGVIDHIRKELIEVATAGDANAAAHEWVDVVILGLDGLTRAIAAGGADWGRVAWIACQMIEAKQTRNEQREWPDWRTAPAGKAIEHIREAV